MSFFQSQKAATKRIIDQGIQKHFISWNDQHHVFVKHSTQNCRANWPTMQYKISNKA